MEGISNPEWLFCESVEKCRIAQKEMSQRVILKDDFSQSIQLIGGVDISNTPFDPKQMIFGAFVICSYPNLSVIESVSHANPQTFPYVRGLLGFREVPTLIQAYQKLTCRPDIIMVDGHGVSHPRGLGIASHLGVVLDLPTIGVAKSLLIGKPAEPLPEKVGSMVPILWKGEEIARMIRTKKRCSPLIVSAGHKISLNTASQLLMQCLTKYKLPEPTRLAHLMANQCRKEFQKI